MGDMEAVRGVEGHLEVHVLFHSEAKAKVTEKLGGDGVDGDGVKWDGGAADGRWEDEGGVIVDEDWKGEGRRR